MGSDSRQGGPASIKAVTVDCWGTLFLDGPGADERYGRQRVAEMQRVLGAAGLKITRGALDEAYLESGRRLAQIWGRRRDVSVREAMLTVLRAVDPALPERLEPRVLAALLEAYTSPARLVPPVLDQDAAPALQELTARGLRLAVVANTMRTPGEVVRQVFEQGGILAPFRVVTFSDECGIRKPDPAIFHLTLEKLGVTPAEAIHVGDDALLDVEGARAAGMRTIHLSADGGAPGWAKPDAVIADLAEMPEAVARIARESRPAGPAPGARTSDPRTLGQVLRQRLRRWAPQRSDECAGA